ncbi:histidine phosphatase family protein [Streptomyces xantholiticus]|uniref:histidine phosphatase family protein n=1 Tax=Streptomyces xantholiticus TaxID=68285 RepID=UPI0016778698|nr:histidine phosphatase family protein [Streptomyces xantholiticus]GGW67768.1 phosphoglycerate mutase [Streptomyces xantholiticus]
MTVRLTLVSPATSEALREFRFDDDSPLDPAGTARAEAAAGTLAPAAATYTSPSLRCRRTAQALGLTAAEPLAALAACNMGRWRGQTLEAVAGTEKEAVALWLSDPTAAPHDGESLQDVRNRVAAWLDTLDSRTGHIIAVAEPDVIRAALIHTLSAPDQAFWRLDVRPLTATELSGRDRRWNLRSGHTL